MTKKEVLEIRHQFAQATCSIDKICGCYVDGDRRKIATMKEAFLSLPEEEAFKYFEIFKKNLSGSIGKNLITMPFPTDSEFDGGTTVTGIGTCDLTICKFCFDLFHHRLHGFICFAEASKFFSLLLNCLNCLCTAYIFRILNGRKMSHRME